MNTKKALLIFFVLVICLLVSFLFVNIISLFTNTLANNGNWINTKSSLEKQVSLAYAFFNKSTTLSRKKLNLGAWNGYNEILYKEPLNLFSVEFRTNINPDSYLVIIFNRTEDGFEGVRIGPYYLFDNIYFKADSLGKFVFKEELSPFHVEPNRWLKVRIVSSEKHLNLYINGKLAYTIDTDFHAGTYFGFRSGEHDVYLDDIHLRFRKSGKLIKEDFGNKKIFIPLFLLTFATLLLGVFFVLKIQGMNKEAVFHFFSLGICLIAVLVFCNIFYYFYSARYPKVEGRLKEKEEYWVANEEKNIMEKMKALYPGKKEEGAYRILFLGSSQTWGAGAAKNEDAFVARINELFNQGLPEDRFEAINAAICGTTTKRLFDLYSAQFVKTDPDMVVIDLSNNDNDYDEREFSEYLTAFVEFNRQRHIETVFVLEPNSIEHRFFLPLHDIMRKVAQKYNIPVIDLNDHLRKNYDSGFLWWDSVHMSSYGHKLSAEYLYKELKKIINARANKG